jgi:cysteine desulfurase family protein
MIYLDNSATSFPKPQATYDQMIIYTQKIAANPGRGSHRLAVQSAAVIYETRELLAQLFNIEDPMRIVFTKNCTEALNIGIKGLLRPGDHVVTTSMEHNSVLRPLHYLTRRGVKVSIVKGNKWGYVDPEDLLSSMTKNTKLVVLTHCSNLTGTIQPIREVGKMCKERGIPFMVDAAQSAGVLPIDVQLDCIDLLAFPGHKGLYGPMGTGGLYISSTLKKMEPLILGGTGSLSHSMEQPDFMPDMYESGTPNLPGIAGLNGGLKYVLEMGIDVIRAHEVQLINRMEAALGSTWNIQLYGPSGGERKGGILLLNIKGAEASEVAQLLDEQSEIYVRPGMHCAPLAHETIGTSKTGAIRLSVGSYNTLDEMDIASKKLIELSHKTNRTIKNKQED